MELRAARSGSTAQRTPSGTRHSSCPTLSRFVRNLSQLLISFNGYSPGTRGISDPPYNVPIDGNVCGNGAIRHREFAMGSGEMNEAEFVAFLTTSLRLLTRHSTSNSVHFVCMDWRHAGELLAAGKQIYESLINLCVWVKNNGGMGSFYRSRHELLR